jgi:hypothetical protein
MSLNREMRRVGKGAARAVVFKRYALTAPSLAAFGGSPTLRISTSRRLACSRSNLLGAMLVDGAHLVDRE